MGWRDLADRGRGLHLTLFYKIVNQEVNATSQGKHILAKGVTRKSHAYNIVMLIESNIDDYKYSFYP